MVCSLGVMALVFAIADLARVDGYLVPVLTDTQGPIALIAANGFVVFFGMSWGPGVWVLLGEMFNNKIRATALGIAASVQRSEERRVGKECRSRWWRYNEQNKHKSIE